MELNLDNILLHSYGCQLCREEAMKLFYDVDVQKAFILYSKLFCKECPTAKMAINYENYKNMLTKYIEESKIRRFNGNTLS